MTVTVKFPSSTYLTLPIIRVLSSKAQGCKIFLITIQTLLCWYSLESSHWVLSDEYPCARVSVILQVYFASFLCLAKLATSSIGVNKILERALNLHVSTCTHGWFQSGWSSKFLRSKKSWLAVLNGWLFVAFCSRMFRFATFLIARMLWNY